MSEHRFVDLLRMAGHREPLRGKRWHCATCPPERIASLNVKIDEEVFFCHRCSSGGGRNKLERELGIMQPKTGPKDKKQRADLEQLCSMVGYEVLLWQRGTRHTMLRRFQKALDEEIYLNQLGMKRLEDGKVVESELIEQVEEARVKRENEEYGLDWFDDLSTEQMVEIYLELPND